MTKVYKYGLLPPTANADGVARQLDLGWRSACALAAIENGYRDQKRDLMQAHLPTVAQIALMEEQKREWRTELTGLRTGREKPRTPRSVELTTSIRRLGESIKALRPAAKEERLVARADGLFTDLETWRKSETLRIEQACNAAGVFWGVRQLVKSAHDQRRGTFKRDHIRVPTSWRSVGVQLHGLPAEHLQTPRTQIYLTAPQPVPGRGGRPLPRVRMQIDTLQRGSEAHMAEWPVVWHRDLPPGTTIQFAQVTRREIGREVKWDLHLVVKMPDPVAHRESSRVVAVVPKFSRSPEGALVMASWADSSGATGVRLLHERIEGGFAKADELRRVRDTRRNELLAAVGEWLRHHPRPSHWPVHLLLWESCNRLRQWVTWWGANRVADDSALYDKAQAWAMQDRHLHDWNAHLTDTAKARRKDAYRGWAADLATRYDLVIVPNTDYAKQKVRGAKPEQQDELSKKAARQSSIASPGLVREVIEQAFAARGKLVLFADGHDPVAMVTSGSGEAKVVTRRAKYSKRHKPTADTSASGPVAADLHGSLAPVQVEA